MVVCLSNYATCHASFVVLTTESLTDLGQFFLKKNWTKTIYPEAIFFGKIKNHHSTTGIPKHSQIHNDNGLFFSWGGDGGILIEI